MKQNDQQQENHLCSVKVDYVDSLRSIDLENILIGLRMIYQHELATQFKTKPRDYTNITRIKGIEKGSILITYIIDWVTEHSDAINTGMSLTNNAIGLSTAIINHFKKKKEKKVEDKTAQVKTQSKSLEVHINNLKGALRNNISITIVENGQNIKITCTESEDIKISLE